MVVSCVWGSAQTSVTCGQSAHFNYLIRLFGNLQSSLWERGAAKRLTCTVSVSYCGSFVLWIRQCCGKHETLSTILHFLCTCLVCQADNLYLIYCSLHLCSASIRQMHTRHMHTRHMQSVTCNPSHATRHMHTRHMQPVTCNPSHATRHMQPVTCTLLSSSAHGVVLCGVQKANLLT